MVTLLEISEIFKVSSDPAVILWLDVKHQEKAVIENSRLNHQPAANTKVTDTP